MHSPRLTPSLAAVAVMGVSSRVEGLVPAAVLATAVPFLLVVPGILA